MAAGPTAMTSSHFDEEVQEAVDCYNAAATVLHGHAREHICYQRGNASAKAA
jgi:hypothetical protein